MKNFRFLKQPSVDEASMKRRWSVDGGSMEDQSPRNGRIAELQNCTIGKTSHLARFAAMLLMLITMSVGQVWADKTIYLNTGGSSLWNQASATFWVHAWGSCGTDKKMTLVEGDLYSVDICDGATSIIFLREKPDATSVVWNNNDGMWNKTNDLSIPNGKNCYTITGWGGSDGGWSSYSPVVPETKYAVTISANAGGSVSPSGSQQIGATGVNVTATPSSGYKFVNWSATGGAAVANPTAATTKVTATADGTVTANFAENLNSGWYVAGSFNNWGSTTDELIKESGSSSVARVTISMSAGNHTFKIYNKDGNKWNGRNSTTVSNGVTITLGNGSGDNLNLTGIAAGNYEFVYNISTRELTVNFPCVDGAGFNIAQPGNGKVGDSFNMAPNIPGDVVGATVSYTCSPAGAVSFDGNIATYLTAANPVSITATLSGGNLCAPVERRTNNFMIEAAAATYTITLKDYNNSVTNGTVTATVGSNTLTGSVTHESRSEGLTFRGYYTAQWAGGTKVIDNTGNLIASAGAYTDASGNWIYEGDVTLIAGWTGNNYTITFDNQEATTAGTANLSVKYSANTNLTEAITVPAKTGYTFGGYYTAPLGGGLQVFDENGAVLQNVGGYVTNGKWMKAANVTLYAKWTAVAPCVPTTYVLKHTTKGEIATFAATANANEYDLTFKLNNDIINGLYVEDNCGNQYGCSTAIQPGQSITLTTAQNTFNFQGAAQNNTWHYTFNSETKVLSCDAQSEEQKAVTTYLIQFFNYNGGDPLQSSRVEEGQTPVYNGATPTRESDAEWNYAFKGWEPALYAANKDQNYSATYNQSRREYTLTWDLAGGHITTPGTAAGSVVNASTLTAPVVEKTGYTFAGWSPAVPATMPAADATYTATWIENKYTVTLANATETSVMAGIATNPEITAAAKTDYTFSSWETTGGASVADAASATTTVSASATGTATATYTLDECRLYYAEGDGTSYTGAMSTSHVMAYDDEQHAYYYDVVTTNTSYYFRFQKPNHGLYAADWNTYPNGTEVLANGAKVSANKDVKDWSNKSICYFRGVAGASIRIWFDYTNKQTWITEQTYTVTINNGDHGTVAPNGDQEVGSAGLDLTVTPESGYIFDGWNTTGGASMDGDHLTASADGTVTATYREAGSTKIYFYNDKDWATVKVHKWGGSATGTTWPGVAADLESITHDGHTIYSVTVTEGEYANIIFNNGNNGNGNQINTVPVHEWTAAKPCLRHTSNQNCEWIALPTQNYQIVYGSKLSVSNSYASGSYVDEGTELTFTAATPDAGYAFAGFFSDGSRTQEITGAGVDIENRTYTVTLNSNIEVHAKYTENLYTVNVAAGEHGSVSPSGDQSVGVVGINVTATPATHYYFKDWTATDGAGVASTTAATTKVTATADGTVTANFTPKWDLRGSFNSWDATDPFVIFDGNNTRVQMNLTAGSYTFKIHHKNANNVSGEWYGKQSTTITRANAETGATLVTGDGDSYNVTLTADKDGIYVFHFNVDTKKLTIDFPVADPSLLIEASAASGTFYTGQTITLIPTTNQKGDLTLCWSCVSKPGEATEPVYTPVAGSTNFTTSVDKAGEYVFSATIGSGECGGSYELLATAPNCTIQVVDAPYSLYINRDGEKDHSLATGSATVHLAAGKEYTFKIHNGETWYTNCSSSTDVNVMNATNNLRWPFNNTNVSYADTRVATTIEGDYTFTLTIGESGNRYVSVTYPEIAGGKEMYSKAVKDANTDVMIQAFYWAHEGNTATDYEPFGSVKWADLDGKELGENFDLVWLAPSTVTADYTGYLPMNYSIQGTITDGDNGRTWLDTYHAPWGSEAELKALIANIHTAGGKAIADIVINHSNSDGGSWCTWNTMKFGNSTNNTLYGSYTPDGTWITYNDEMYVSKTNNQYGQKEQAGDCGNMPEGLYPDDWYATYGSTTNGKHWDYTEYNCTYSRDWAHQKREVREMSRAYLLWLKNEIGYDGWRYDFAKGFHGKYINDYNHASGAYFSVAEVFDGDYRVEEGVLADAGNNTYMFDFPGKYNLMNNAIRNGWYQGLQGTAERTLLYGHKKHAVTFVDNHDTFREGYNLSGQANQMPNLGNQVLQANAYILSMPGVPCVFYPYWYEFKDEIKAMIWARRWTGVNSESNVTDEEAADGKYLAVINGTNGSLYLKLGPKAGVNVCPDGYQCAYTGTNVGVYYKVTDASLVKPMISCDKESQEFVGSIPVTFTAKGADVAYTIYYTINGGAEQTVASGTAITIGATANVDDEITVTAYAKSEGGIPSNTLTYTYTKKLDKITLTAAPSAATVGSTVTLTPTAQSGQNHNYHFFVKEPGATNFMSCGFTEEGAALNYVMAGEGYYQFYVTTTNTDPIYTSNTVRVNAEALVYHLRYKKTGAAWTDVTMSPNGDGTYVYYDADARADISNGANVGLNGTDSDPYFNSEKIANPDGASDGDNVVWVYNAFEQTLKVNNPGYHVYRIKVTLTDGRDFYSNIIYQTGSAVDVSFYAQTDAELTLERYGKNQENKFTWEEIGSIVTPSIASNGVYTTTARVTVTAAHDDVPDVTSCTLAEPLTAYDEPYYITTPGQPAPGSTPTKPNYEMTKFDGSHTYYNHYYVAWMQGGQNTYGTVGNTINKNLAGAVGYYKLIGDENTGANVRYAYNPETNVFTRTHLAGSTSGRFLATFGTNVQDTTAQHNNLTSALNGQILMDASGWMYATEVRVNQEGTGVASSLKLAAQYNGAYTYLLSETGLDSDEAKKVLTVVGNVLGDYPQFGVIYDYKTNHIVAGWDPAGVDVTEHTEIDNVIIVRQDDANKTEFSISGEGSVAVVEQMTTQFIITRDMWDNWHGDTFGDAKRMYFWFSLPYGCLVGDVFGFSECNAKWEIQRYRGDLRSAGTAGDNAWRRLKPTAVMEPNRGYVLMVELKYSDFHEIRLVDDETVVSQLSLFFPSAGPVTLTTEPQTMLDDLSTGAAPEIQRDWHSMGVPLMKTGGTVKRADEPERAFRYYDKPFGIDGVRWYEPHMTIDNDHQMRAMNAYMVQGHGTYNWTYPAAVAPSPVIARAKAAEAQGGVLRLDLIEEEDLVDRTYVEFAAESTRAYEMSADMEKLLNPGRSMLYSEQGDELAVISIAADDQDPIALTLVAAESAQYTLRLHVATEGLEPVLYDAQEDLYIMLNQCDYTVDLTAGTYKNRFYLQNRPRKVTTSFADGEATDSEGRRIVKYVEDGKLYILREGKIYNAEGRLVH